MNTFTAKILILTLFFFGGVHFINAQEENDCPDVTNVNITNPSGTDLFLTWSAANPTPSDGYVVVIYDENGDEADRLETPNTSLFFMNDLTEGTYTVVVYSVCDATNEIWSDGVGDTVIFGDAPQLCPDVIDLIITPNEEEQTITLSWTEPEGTNEGYNVSVYGFELGFGYDEIVTGNAVTVENITLGDMYSIMVVTVCDEEEGNYSLGTYSEIIFGEAQPCEEVSNFDIIVNENNSVTLTWEEPISTNEGFYIRIMGTDNDYFDEIIIEENTFTSEVLEPGNYSVMIQTVCNIDAAVMSEGITDSFEIEEIVTPEACDAPTNLEATSSVNGFVTITWDAPNEEVDNFGVLIVVSGETPNFDESEIVNGTTYLAGVLENNTYDIYVFSVCDLDEDLVSDNSSTTITVQTMTSVSEESILINSYPNPVKDILTVETNTTKGELVIVDMMGRRLESVLFLEKIVTLNLEQLPSGVYQVVLTSKQGKKLINLLRNKKEKGKNVKDSSVIYLRNNI